MGEFWWPSGMHDTGKIGISNAILKKPGKLDATEWLEMKTHPLSARIVALADVFDAMVTKRPYKQPWPIDQVMTTLRDSAGSHFEPRLVQVFESILPRILAIKAVWDSKERHATATR